MEIDADLLIERAAEDFAALVKDMWILRAKVEMLESALRIYAKEDDEDDTIVSNQETGGN